MCAERCTGGGENEPVRYFPARIFHLDDSVHTFQVPHTTLGVHLYQAVIQKLGILEADYFDLEFVSLEGIRCWLDHQKTLVKQVGPDRELIFRFSVKFYTPHPNLLEEEYTRYLFALQIKRDLLGGQLICSENTSALLASYIVQASVGDFLPEEYTDTSYLKPLKFLNDCCEDRLRKVMEFHKKHIGLMPAEADFNLLDTARKVEYFGIRMHLAKDHEGLPLNLSVSHTGIVVFQNLTRINNFSWAKIRKLSFKRKRFLIKLHPDGPQGYYKEPVEFYFENRDECKRFWKKSIEHHAFFRCHIVDCPVKKKSKMVTKGSSFRYSGRTQKQLIEYARENAMKRPLFDRPFSWRAPPITASNSQPGSTLYSPAASTHQSSQQLESSRHNYPGGTASLSNYPHSGAAASDFSADTEFSPNSAYPWSGSGGLTASVIHSTLDNSLSNVRRSEMSERACRSATHSPTHNRESILAQRRQKRKSGGGMTVHEISTHAESFDDEVAAVLQNTRANMSGNVPQTLNRNSFSSAAHIGRTVSLYDDSAASSNEFSSPLLMNPPPSQHSYSPFTTAGASRAFNEPSKTDIMPNTCYTTPISSSTIGRVICIDQYSSSESGADVLALSHSHQPTLRLENGSRSRSTPALDNVSNGTIKSSAYSLPYQPPGVLAGSVKPAVSPAGSSRKSARVHSTASVMVEAPEKVVDSTEEVSYVLRRRHITPPGTIQRGSERERHLDSLSKIDNALGSAFQQKSYQQLEGCMGRVVSGSMGAQLTTKRGLNKRTDQTRKIVGSTSKSLDRAEKFGLSDRAQKSKMSTNYTSRQEETIETLKSQLRSIAPSSPATSHHNPTTTTTSTSSSSHNHPNSKQTGSNNARFSSFNQAEFVSVSSLPPVNNFSAKDDTATPDFLHGKRRAEESSDTNYSSIPTTKSSTSSLRRNSSGLKSSRDDNCVRFLSTSDPDIDIATLSRNKSDRKSLTNSDDCGLPPSNPLYMESSGSEASLAEEQLSRPQSVSNMDLTIQTPKSARKSASHFSNSSVVSCSPGMRIMPSVPAGGYAQVSTITRQAVSEKVAPRSSSSSGSRKSLDDQLVGINPHMDSPSYEPTGTFHRQSKSQSPAAREIGSRFKSVRVTMCDIGVSTEPGQLETIPATLLSGQPCKTVSVCKGDGRIYVEESSKSDLYLKSKGDYDRARMSSSALTMNVLTHTVSSSQQHDTKDASSRAAVKPSPPPRDKKTKRSGDEQLAATATTAAASTQEKKRERCLEKDRDSTSLEQTTTTEDTDNSSRGKKKSRHHKQHISAGAQSSSSRHDAGDLRSTGEDSTHRKSSSGSRQRSIKSRQLLKQKQEEWSEDSAKIHSEKCKSDRVIPSPPPIPPPVGSIILVTPEPQRTHQAPNFSEHLSSGGTPLPPHVQQKHTSFSTVAELAAKFTDSKLMKTAPSDQIHSESNQEEDWSPRHSPVERKNPSQLPPPLPPKPISSSMMNSQDVSHSNNHSPANKSDNADYLQFCKSPVPPPPEYLRRRYSQSSTSTSQNSDEEAKTEVARICPESQEGKSVIDASVTSSTSIDSVKWPVSTESNGKQSSAQLIGNHVDKSKPGQGEMATGDVYEAYFESSCRNTQKGNRRSSLLNRTHQDQNQHVTEEAALPAAEGFQGGLRPQADDLIIGSRTLEESVERNLYCDSSEHTSPHHSEVEADEYILSHSSDEEDVEEDLGSISSSDEEEDMKAIDDEDCSDEEESNSDLASTASEGSEDIEPFPPPPTDVIDYVEEQDEEYEEEESHPLLFTTTTATNSLPVTASSTSLTQSNPTTCSNSSGNTPSRDNIFHPTTSTDTTSSSSSSASFLSGGQCHNMSENSPGHLVDLIIENDVNYGGVHTANHCDIQHG